MTVGDLFLVCFWLGLVLTILLSLSGTAHLFHWHVHPGHGASVLHPTTVLTFLTTFGGVGYLLTKAGFVGGVIIVVVALAAGLFLAWLVFLMLIKVFVRGEQVMEERDYELVGTVGHVSVSIAMRGVGEVKYVLHDTIRSIGARSADGRALASGTKVVIESTARGIATVVPFDEYFAVVPRE